MTNTPKDPNQARAAVSVHGISMIEHASVAYWNRRDEGDTEYHWGQVHKNFATIADALGYEITRKETE